MKIKINMKKRSHRYDMETNIINIYKMCLGMMMPLCIKQHLSNIWSSDQEKIKQSSGWVEKKSVGYKKACFIKGFTHSVGSLTGSPVSSLYILFNFPFSHTKLGVLTHFETKKSNKEKRQTSQKMFELC